MKASDFLKAMEEMKEAITEQNRASDDHFKALLTEINSFFEIIDDKERLDSYRLRELTSSLSKLYGLLNEVINDKQNTLEVIEKYKKEIHNLFSKRKLQDFFYFKDKISPIIKEKKLKHLATEILKIDEVVFAIPKQTTLINRLSLIFDLHEDELASDKIYQQLHEHFLRVAGYIENLKSSMSLHSTKMNVELSKQLQAIYEIAKANKKNPSKHVSVFCKALYKFLPSYVEKRRSRVSLLACVLTDDSRNLFSDLARVMIEEEGIALMPKQARKSFLFCESYTAAFYSINSAKRTGSSVSWNDEDWDLESPRASLKS